MKRRSSWLVYKDIQELKTGFIHIQNVINSLNVNDEINGAEFVKFNKCLNYTFDIIFNRLKEINKK